MTSAGVFSYKLMEILRTPNISGLEGSKENTYVGILFQ